MNPPDICGKKHKSLLLHRIFTLLRNLGSMLGGKYFKKKNASARLNRKRILQCSFFVFPSVGAFGHSRNTPPPFKNLKFHHLFMKGKLAILAFVSLLLFSGCIGMDEVTGSRDYYSEPDYGYSSKGMAAPMAATESGSYGGYDSYDYESNDQMIIKEGSVSINVETGTLEQKQEELSILVTQYNAEVSSIWFNEYTTEKRYAITLKLAPSKFDAFMDDLATLGEIKNIDTSFDDVSEQYTDLQTRINNLQEELARLNELYAQAENVEEILMIEREVTRVQTDLEIYQSRALDLERRSAQSTVTVYLIEEKPELQTDFLLPLEDVVALFLGALSTAILLIVGLAGFIIPLAILFVVLRAIYRALHKNKKQKATKK